MDVNQLIELEVRARELLAQLETELARDNPEAAAVAPDAAIGRLSRIDSMQHQEMAKEARRRKEQRLQLLREALQRMDDGTYGTCVRCEGEMDIARLNAAPETKFCRECAVG
ncbi:MAG: TraR/DksA C4-type zinc finger protein [Chthoniobacteraceae bacterium]